MYNATVTIFNLYESRTAAMWYPHVLSGVDLITDKGQLLKKYGPDNTDNAELHIVYEQKDEKRIIRDASGKELPWLPPKAWKSQVNDLLDDSVTFGPDDFFMEGEWTDGIVDEENYTSGFYDFMNNQYDFVFLISSVGGPYSVIPHFEILGK